MQNISAVGSRTGALGLLALVPLLWASLTWVAPAAVAAETCARTDLDGAGFAGDVTADPGLGWARVGGPQGDADWGNMNDYAIDQQLAHGVADLCTSDPVIVFDAMWRQATASDPVMTESARLNVSYNGVRYAQIETPGPDNQHQRAITRTFNGASLSPASPDRQSGIESTMWTRLTLDLPAGVPASAPVSFSISETHDNGTVGNEAADDIWLRGISANLTQAQVPVGTPAIRLTKTASPDKGLLVGDQVTYRMVATNAGDAPLSGVTVTESSFSGDGSLSAVTCDRPVPATLAPGASLRCTARYRVVQTDLDVGRIDNVARACAVPSPCDASGVTVTTMSRPGIHLDKRVAEVIDVDGNGLTEIGDKLAYRFDVKNTGNVSLVGLKVNDDLLARHGIGVTCPQTKLAPGASATCAADAPYLINKPDVDAGFVLNIALGCADRVAAAKHRRVCDRDQAQTPTDGGTGSDGVSSGAAGGGETLPRVGGSGWTYAELVLGIVLMVLGAGLVRRGCKDPRSAPVY